MLSQGQPLMSKVQKPLNGNMVGAFAFTMARAIGTVMGLVAGQLLVLEYGMFFTALCGKIMMVSHDGIYRYPLGTLGLTLT